MAVLSSQYKVTGLPVWPHQILHDRSCIQLELPEAFRGRKPKWINVRNVKPLRYTPNGRLFIALPPVIPDSADVLLVKSTTCGVCESHGNGGMRACAQKPVCAVHPDGRHSTYELTGSPGPLPGMMLLCPDRWANRGAWGGERWQDAWKTLDKESRPSNMNSEMVVMT